MRAGCLTSILLHKLGAKWSRNLGSLLSGLPVRWTVGPGSSGIKENSLHFDSSLQHTALKLTKIMSDTISQLSVPCSTVHFGYTVFPVVWAFVKNGGNSPLFLPPTSKKTYLWQNGNSVSQPALPALLEATCLAIS